MTKRYGVIGCGMMGQEHIANINLLDGAKVDIVYDPVTDIAQYAARKSGDARIANSISELASASGLDAIVIASPNHMHVDNLEAIAQAATLPILCEKPFYSHPDQEKSLDAFLSRYDAPVWVAMEYRYMPPIAEFITQCDVVTGGIKMLTIKEHRFPFLPKIGDWNRFNANSGGTLVEKCCHFFDLMRHILQSEPVRVSASAGQMVNHLDERYNGETPDIWDAGYMIFDFENGARAMLELCMFAEGTVWNEEISAVGSSGKIECRLPGPHRFWPASLGKSPDSQISIYPRHPKNPVTRDIAIDEALLQAGDHHGSTFFQHRKFLDVVNGNGRVEVTPEDGKRAVKMGLMAQKAAQTYETLTF